jgi:hypothetical protein
VFIFHIASCCPKMRTRVDVKNELAKVVRRIVARCYTRTAAAKELREAADQLVRQAELLEQDEREAQACRS